MLLERFPYGIIYSINEDHIMIYAIMHLKRNPVTGYHGNRLWVVLDYQTRNNIPHRTITLATSSPEWQERFELEKRKLEAALGDSCRCIHHIGSTAITGIAAKPIIDIFVEADALDPGSHQPKE